MTIRIPYPIPEPERGQLMQAGIDACTVPLNSPDRTEEQVAVRRVIAEIALRYGVIDEEAAA
jgi:hypothetical protein